MWTRVAEEPSKRPPHSAMCPAPAPASVPPALSARPGAPLPESIRQPAEARYGHSFADVRVHADRDAHSMAAAAQARAFTLGRDIVFGAGQYAPGTDLGNALIWHELGHVAGPAATGTVLRAPLFRTEDLTFSPPPKGLSEAGMRAQVDAKTRKTPPDITRWTIKGAVPTEEAYIFLEEALFEFGSRKRWDSVVHLEMDIGWEQKVSAGAGIIPSGLVTISIDPAGVATAELVSRVATNVAPALGPGAAAAKLKATFGMDAVAGDKPWSDSELEQVVQAVDLLRATDRDALRGVQLMRYSTLPKGRAGDFTAGGGVAREATRVSAKPTLRLADLAFPSHRFAAGPTGAATSLPGSEQTILHEVGHAVEEALWRAAHEAEDTAVIRQHVAIQAQKAALDRWRKVAGTPDAWAASDEHTKRAAATLAATTRASAAKASLASTQVSAKVVAQLEADVAAKKTAYDTARRTAGVAVGAMNPQETAESLTYRSAVDDLARLISEYGKKAQPGADRDQLDDGLVAAQDARKKARAALAAQNAANPALAAFDPVDTAEDDWMHAARMLGHTRGRTKRLQKFVDLVNASGFQGVTQYARDNWPYKPEEFYAETFSLWLTEPAFLQKNYPALFDFFDKGDYAK